MAPQPGLCYARSRGAVITASALRVDPCPRRREPFPWRPCHVRSASACPAPAQEGAAAPEPPRPSAVAARTVDGPPRDNDGCAGGAERGHLRDLPRRPP